MGDIDRMTWNVFGLLLTCCGLAVTYVRYQKKGLWTGVRGVGWSLIPLGLALTGVLRLTGQILDDVGVWATRLVFSPSVWLGFIILGLAAALVAGARLVEARRPKSGQPRAVTSAASRQAKPGRNPAVGDDDLDDIEAILRKHGIQ